MLLRSTCLAVIASLGTAAFAATPIKKAADVPRLSDGKPDLNGIWQSLSGADVNLLDHVADRYAPGGQSVVEEGELPYLPEARKQRDANNADREKSDPQTAKCNLPGVPRITYAHNLPFQIFQKPKGDRIVVLYEFAEAHRFLYTNGTPHPPGHINWNMGDSRSKWEGDTLVVDSVDFNDLTWFDHAGDFHSESLHVIERYRLLDADHLEYKVEVDDPKVYSKPWHINLVLYRRKEKNQQLLDYVCYAFDLAPYYP
jgi:hypothetical protein